MSSTPPQVFCFFIVNLIKQLFLFQIGSRSSVYSPESRIRKTGSFIYEDFMPTDGTDVKVSLFIQALFTHSFWL